MFSTASYTHEIFKHTVSEELVELPYPICIAAYHITDNGCAPPFIRFLLEQTNNRVLQFPSINNITGCTKVKQLCIEKMNGFGFTLLRYKGYVIYCKTIFVFIEIQDAQPCVQLQPRNMSMVLGLLDEILNYREVCGLRVDMRNIEFILSNPDFYLLKQPGAIAYEIPYVAIMGYDNIHQVEIDGRFGPMKTNFDYYYFSPCTDTHHYEGGVNRYAIFGTHPVSMDGKTQWLVEDETQFVALSYTFNI